MTPSLLTFTQTTLAPLIAALAPALHAANATKPNIIFILADDLGSGDLGCIGAPDIETPHIGRLAVEGVKFIDFYANAPVCTPTRAGCMTGRW